MEKACTFAPILTLADMRQHTEPTRMFDLPESPTLAMRYVSAFSGTDGQRRRSLSLKALRSNSDCISYALLHRGVRRGDVVGIISEGRAECAYINLGIMQIGALPLELDANLTAEQYITLLADARLLIVDDEAMFRRFRVLAPQLERLKDIVAIASDADDLDLGSLLDEGRRYSDRTLLQRCKSLITTDETCLLEYRGGDCRLPLSHKAKLQSLMA